METIYTNMTVSITELKRNFSAVLKQADDCPVAILNHNRPEAYLLPALHYERLIAHLEDLEDTKLVQDRSNGPFIEVSIDAL
jgi:antitoxin StbD